MSKKILAVMLAGVFFMSGCAESAGTDDTNPLSELDSRVVEAVLENDESGDVVTASDVAIDRIFYGSFSKPETEEALVVCRILNTPHVGGLDRRAIIILDVGSMDVVAYDEIPADEVWISTLPMSSGQDRIIFSAQTTYQGISTQNVMYFCIEDGQWAETPVEESGLPGEGCFCFLAGDTMLVTSERELTGASDITAVLTWDQELGSFH